MSSFQPLLLRSWLLVAVLIGSGQASWGDDLVRVVSLGSPSGVKTFAPGKWGLVAITVVNESPEAVTVRATVHLKANPALRFGRDVWVPAHAKRTTSIAVHLPRQAVGTSSFEIVGRVVSGGTLASSLDGGALARVAPPGTTAFLDDIGSWDAQWYQSEQTGRVSKDPAHEVLLAMRGDRRLLPAVMTVGERLLPTAIEGWDSLQQVVVAGKRLAREPGAAAALRQWVSEGGRMWIQLNRSDLATVRALFGSALPITIVDRVPLNTFEIQYSDSAIASVAVDREEPVELIRAHVERGHVLFDVDHWPAAIEFEYGRGSVLVTLLDAHGWMRPRSYLDPPSPPLSYTDFIALDPLAALAQRMYDRRAEQTFDRDVVATYVTDRIGYRIPARNTVLAILLLFCGVIFLCGLGLASRHQLEHLSWLAASAAVAATVVLVVIGKSYRGEVPPTIADFQWVNISPQTGDYTASGAVATYQPEQVRADFRSDRSRIDPELPELGGEIREMIWTDGKQWQWDQTPLPPGVMLLESESAGTFPAPVHARGALGPRGLQGHFDHQGLIALLDQSAMPQRAQQIVIEDALVLFPHSPPLAANLQPAGDFLSGEQDRLAPGQYTNRTLLDEEQRRRQRLLDHWLSHRHASGTITQPLLVAWLNNAQTGFRSAQASERIATTLVTIPLELIRPPAGTPVAIPSPLIRIRSVHGGLGHSTAFDNQNESWSFPNSRSSRTRLRFQMPRSTLPLRLDAVTLVLDCNVPSRALEVFAVQGERQTPVGRYVNASGSIATRIDDPQWLVLDEGGGLQLEIAVGDSQSFAERETISQSGWSIFDSRLEVSGTTLPVESLSE